MLTEQGSAYAKVKGFSDATTAFRKAEGYANSALAWFSLCSAAYKLPDVAIAVAACDRAIAASPDKGGAYFLKGMAMLGASKTGSDGKVVPPEGTFEILQKSLDLDPNGPSTKAIREILSKLK